MDFLCKALTLTLAVFVKAESCEVGVSPPWERITYIPQNSILRINCTANSSVHNPVWSILLSGTTAISQFSFPQTVALLNSRGFYEILVPEVPGTLKTIQLLVNSTQRNNGTLIKCNDVVSSTLFSETNLIIIEPSPVIMDTTDLHLQTINISWSSLIQSIYTLTINSNTDQPQILNLNQTYYVFTALEDAPPCKIYNFSVTATYIGATYTGTDCSVPSPVISRMLPSLPNIGPAIFNLEKQSNGITLNSSLEIATYCDLYPVTNYTMEIKQISSENDMQSLKFGSTTNHIIADNLLENEIYKFQMTAWNSVGSVSSDAITVYTTDVQKAVVTLKEFERNVTCHFLTGSDALGCMVILIGQFSNHTMKLMKRSADSNITEHTEELKLKDDSLSLSCYNRIVAFDIESDGSVGALPVPGYLMSTSGHLERAKDGPCIGSRSSITVGTSGSKGVIPQYAAMKVMITVYIVSFLYNRS